MNAMNWALENWSTNYPDTVGIASMSLGGGYSSAQNAAVKKMHDAGMLVIVAAGNSNKDACTGSPSSAPEAFTVGASSIDDSRAYFSEFGKCVDIFAPGDQIYSTLPNEKYGYLSGTSMATPFVAGFASYIGTILHEELKRVPTPDEIKFAVQCNGDQDSITDAKTVNGNVLPFDDMTNYNPDAAYCQRYKVASSEIEKIVKRLFN
jgi:subtilisin family serine protease